MIGVDGDDEKPNEKNVIAFTSLLPLKPYEVSSILVRVIVKFFL